MMGKKTGHILIACLALFLHGCIEDAGNYNYETIESVIPGQVAELDEQYNVVSLNYLDIDLQIGADETEYDYRWYVYYPSGYPADTETIGNERHLNYCVVLPTGSYQLVLEVKKRTTQASVYRKAILNVTSSLGYGWYVTKKINNRTDIDFFNLADNTFHSDILQTINGESPSGNPLGSCYTTNSLNTFTGYSYEVEYSDGTVALMRDKSAVFVLTDEDLQIYNADDMIRLKTFDDAFLEAPQQKLPQKVWMSYLGQCIINNGRFHGIWSSSYNVGKFGYQIGAGDYTLSPYIISFAYGFVFYDKNNGSFKKMNVYDGTTILSDVSGMPAGCELVYMQEKSYLSMFGAGANNTFALVRDKNTGYCTILNLDILNHFFYNTSLVTASVAVPAASGLTEATLFALNNAENHPVMYYSKGDHKIGAYNLATGVETDDFISFPSGENVSYFKHLYIENKNTGRVLLQLFVTLTNTATGWKLRAFDFQTGADGWNVKPEPSTTIEGEGNAQHVFYRDVNVAFTN